MSLKKYFSKKFFEIRSFGNSQYIAVRKGKNLSETEVLQLQKEMTVNSPPGEDIPDEELIDTLMAISVVAKRLAKKLEENKVKGDTENGTHE